MKNILITGSTDGIGKLAAIELVKKGHSIILHGRNKAKLNSCITEIEALASNPNIKGFVADFSNLEEVKAMAEQVKNEIPKLDVLINNAGIYNSSIAKNKDGLDIRMVVNYLAPYVLTHELMPLLSASNEARIINLSSAAQKPVSLDALTGKEDLSESLAYAQSKLALTMWTFDLAAQHPNITITALNPGSLLDTKMVSEAFGKHWSSADKGANIIHDLAISEEYNGVTGKYFDNDLGKEKGAFGPAHSDSYDQGLIKELLATTEALLS